MLIGCQDPFVEKLGMKRKRKRGLSNEQLMAGDL